MNSDSQTDGAKLTSAQRDERQQVPREWQFSLRGLFILTTILCAYLALAAALPLDEFVLLSVMLFLVAVLLSVEWLIRPANRHILACVTAGLWMFFGIALLIISIAIAMALITAGSDDSVWLAVVLFTLMAIACFRVGRRTWRQLTAYRRENL
jgi:hypothetical protein